MPIGFGIVGCGMIAGFHAKAIEHIRGAKIVACYDTYTPGAERFAAANDCRHYAELKELLSDREVQIVTICTPSGAHRDPAVAAARAGKHVVVEKPLEITLARCDAIINACRKNNVKLCTIFPSRFSPVNQALRDALAEGRFGRPTLGDAYTKWWRTQQYYDSGGWRGTWEFDGGGAYMNQAIHSVDLLYCFMGEVAEVTGATATLAHERIEVEDVGVATLRFKSGALGVIEATTAAWPGMLKRLEIHGTEGTAVIEEDSLLVWEFAKKSPKDTSIRRKFMKETESGGGASDPTAISYQGHMRQLKDFIDAIQTGVRPLVDGEEGRKSVEIILAIYKAAWTGRRVELPLKSDPRRPAGSTTGISGRR
ncbi:MAG: Gfo/Idh/MocA family oxidoreductase [Planctomycetes bacterium]|nr:Gfo/Idh/MocA family oxidoreductase [Planctomycetota bacterium]